MTAVDPRKIREHRGDQRQAFIAARAGISERHLRNIEKGVTVPSADVLGRIADALGVSIDRLMTNGGPDA